MRTTRGGLVFSSVSDDQKLPWSSNYQTSATLAVISVVLWFLFDGTWHGFVMSLLFSSIGTAVMHWMVSHGVYRSGRACEWKT
jgi:hypothetical protein